MQGKPERRQFLRVDRSFVVSYTVVEVKSPKADITQTRNISEGGILFTTDKELAQGAMLDIKLKVPQAADYIDIKGEVVDSKKRGSGMLCDTRVKFIEIKDKDLHFIKEVIEHGSGK
ncbi:MAG: PilZ domain-containing protein [Candidatus Omnitrophota bacterium]